MKGLKIFLRYLLLLALATGFITNAVAVELSDLYVAEVPVASQGNEDRQRAIQQALVRVLIKVSGNAQVAVTPGVPELLAQANRYVAQYRYLSKPVAQQNTKADASQPLNQTFLHVEFASKGLGTAMQGLGIPLWGRARPATLIWIAYDDQGERNIVSENQGSEIQRLLADQAQLRGMPLLWPLLDLEDQAKISFADIWGGFDERIKTATVRYEVQSWLVGRLLHRGGNFWEARWQLVANGASNSWQTTGKLEDVMLTAANTTTDTLAQLYVRAGNVASKQIKIKITDLHSASDFASAERFIRKLELVDSVQLELLQASTAVFAISLNGDNNDFQQAINLSNQKSLVPVESPPPATVPNATSVVNANLPTEPIYTYRFLQ